MKISENEYDLFLRIDSNTQGHIFWFYFSVKNMKKGRKIKFNLANLTKNDTHYTKVIFVITEARVLILICAHQRRRIGHRKACRMLHSNKNDYDTTFFMKN